MPYRRLPTTDQARKRAITAALRMGETMKLSDLAFSKKSLEVLNEFQNEFEIALRRNKEEQDKQLERNKAFTEFQRKARMYVSHFIQVLNMAILRDEIKPRARVFYGLNTADITLPPLGTEEEILEWGEKVINGEQQRINEGGSPIYNPSIALVKVHFSAFKDVYMLQKVFQDDSSLVKTGIIMLREKADNIIRQMWNEIEESFEYLSPKEKRKKAAQYGVIYVLRRKELKVEKEHEEIKEGVMQQKEEVMNQKEEMVHQEEDVMQREIKELKAVREHVIQRDLFGF